MKRRAFLATSAALGLGAAALHAQTQARRLRFLRAATVSGVSPVANNEHPRLLLVPDGYSHARTLSQQATIFSNGGARDDEFANWRTFMDGEYTTPSLVGDLDGCLMFALAFLMVDRVTLKTGAWGRTKAQYGTRARTHLMALANLMTNGSGDECAQSASIAMDWLQADGDTVLSAGDKTTLMAEGQQDSMDDGTYPRSDHVPDVQVLGNSQYVMPVTQKMLIALALAGSGADNSWCTAVIAAFEAYFRNDEATTNHQCGVSYLHSYYGSTTDLLAGGYDGGVPQGDDYGINYILPFTLVAEEGYRTAMGISAATHYGTDDTKVYRAFPNYVAFLHGADVGLDRASNGSYPDSYQWWPTKTNGMAWPELPMWYGAKHAAVIAQAMNIHAKLGNTTEAGIARWILDHRVGAFELGSGAGVSAGPNGRWYIPAEVGYDSTIAAVDPATVLPLSAYHNRGFFTFRYPNWTTGIDKPFVHLSAQRWWCGTYSLAMPGSIAVFYNGPAILRPGIGIHAVGGMEGFDNCFVFPDRTKTWQQQTAAGTVVAEYGASENGIAHPDGTLGGGDNTGTIRKNFNLPGLKREDIWATDEFGDTRGTRRFRAATAVSEFNYALVDLTRHYDYNIGGTTQVDSASASGGRLSSFVRQMVYLLPATVSDPVRIFMHDRITKIDTKYESVCAIATLAADPSFDDGSPSAGPSRGSQGTTGKTHSTTTTGLTATNNINGATNRTFVTPLLPSSRDVIKIGYGLDGDEFPAYYENHWGVLCYDAQPLTSGGGVKKHTASARYRIEVVPSSSALTENFLNVIEVAPSTSATKSTTAAITGSGFEGARCGNGAAVFGSDGISKTSGSFTLPASFSGKLIVAGLSPSTTRTLDPDANGTINALSAGAAYAASSGDSGTLVVDIVVGGSPCTVTVS